MNFIKKNQYEILFQGVEGVTKIEHVALPRIAQALNGIADKVDALDTRITVLEAASKTTDDNENIKRALMDAHNALEQAISFFRKKAEENKQ